MPNQTQALPETLFGELEERLPTLDLTTLALYYCDLGHIHALVDAVNYRYAKEWEEDGLEPLLEALADIRHLILLQILAHTPQDEAEGMLRSQSIADWTFQQRGLAEVRA
ncbi:hypothetical protein RHODOSMS8_00013 [Rhodobiaceae bacterium]|nr:hypothetical protein RHODOSMS8_00013 [Rhodobiaceae bacterium]